MLFGNQGDKCTDNNPVYQTGLSKNFCVNYSDSVLQVHVFYPEIYSVMVCCFLLIIENLL